MSACSGTIGGAGGGGGAGLKYLTGLTPGNTITVTVGAAGTAGPTTVASGGNGGTTQISSGTEIITTVSVSGGDGGRSGQIGGSGSGGLGGSTSSGTDLFVPGGDGDWGGGGGIGFVRARSGGSLFAPSSTMFNSSQDGKNYGGGAAPQQIFADGTLVGFAGGNGLVIFEY
jgi:hypothetical protein